jgi:hypothetical protein
MEAIVFQPADAENFPSSRLCSNFICCDEEEKTLGSANSTWWTLVDGVENLLLEETFDPSQPFCQFRFLAPFPQ